MSWYTLSQQPRKKLFVVEFKPDKSPNTTPQTKALHLDNEAQARGYVKKLFPNAVILTVKETNKYRVKFNRDFSYKEEFEDVIADTPEQAKKIIKDKFPNAFFNSEPRNLGIEVPVAKYLPDGREVGQSNSDFLGKRHQENKETLPWERDNPLKKRL